jgi:hypothetical protein
LDGANVGDFGWVQSLVDARLFERCREVLVISFVHLLLPFQVFNLGGQLRKLFRPPLNIFKVGLKRLDFCLGAGDLRRDLRLFIPRFFLSPSLRAAVGLLINKSLLFSQLGLRGIQLFLGFRGLSGKRR